MEVLPLYVFLFSTFFIIKIPIEQYNQLLSTLQKVLCSNFDFLQNNNCLIIILFHLTFALQRKNVKQEGNTQSGVALF